MCYFDYALYKRAKKITFILNIAAPLIIIGYLFFYAFTPQSFKYEKPKIITISEGDSLKKVTFRLYRKELINNPYLFYFIGFITGYSRYIQAGAYYVSIDQSPADVYHEFVNGKIATAKIIVPPGSNIFEIASILSKHKITGKKPFLKECFDKKFLLSIKVDAKSAEGFLYPDTFIFKINSKPQSVIKEMVSDFFKKTKNLKPALNYKNLIIASLIIKEADEKKQKTAAIISSVIHNRLKINMPLDIDSSSIYAKNLIVYKKYFRSADKFKLFLHIQPQYLKIKSPYNTYLNYGLPPTPIANPNLEAIRLAMNPPKTKYLYYISAKSGRTIFSANLAGQIKNIDKYLKK